MQNGDPLLMVMSILYSMLHLPLALDPDRRWRYCRTLSHHHYGFDGIFLARIERRVTAAELPHLHRKAFDRLYQSQQNEVVAPPSVSSLVFSASATAAGVVSSPPWPQKYDRPGHIFHRKACTTSFLFVNLRHPYVVGFLDLKYYECFY